MATLYDGDDRSVRWIIPGSIDDISVTVDVWRHLTQTRHTLITNLVHLTIYPTFSRLFSVFQFPNSADQLAVLTLWSFQVSVNCINTKASTDLKQMVVPVEMNISAVLRASLTSIVSSRLEGDWAQLTWGNFLYQQTRPYTQWFSFKPTLVLSK